MKIISVFALLLLFAFSVQAQLEIRNDSGEFLKTNNFKKFSEINGIDSAYYYTTSSPWLSTDKMIYSIIKKSGHWYSSKIVVNTIFSPFDTKVSSPAKFFTYMLSQSMVDSLFHTTPISKALNKSQAQFDALPEQCKFEVNGSTEFSSISDAETYYLIGYRNRGNSLIQYSGLMFYAPDFFLNECPNKQYEIV